MGNCVTAPLVGWNVRGHSYAELMPTGDRHPGLDLNVGGGDADLGMPVVAFLDGVVAAKRVWSGSSYGYGHLLLLEHEVVPEQRGGLKLWSLYAHLDSFDEAARVGEKVSAGQPIATCGKSGLQRDAHLHFEVRYKGPPEMAIDFWGGRLNPEVQSLRYADPYTLLRVFEGVELSLGSPELLAQLAGARAEVDALRGDRDWNYGLKMRFEAFLRDYEARRRIKRGTTDRLIAEVAR